MSVTERTQKLPEECTENPCHSVELVIEPRPRDLGDFEVKRVLPFAKRRMVGPWIFFDHMGPATFGKEGAAIDVRPHPHINLATVTYLFQGEILHKDSLGSVQAITPGAINLMVAGKGITHSERTSEALRHTPHTVEGLQLWFALPEDKEEIDPAFYHYAADEIPSTRQEGTDIRVMMGTAFGLTSPVKTFSDILYAEIVMKAGSSLPLPQTQERAVYVVTGAVTIDGIKITAGTMAVLSENAQVELTAEEDSKYVIIGGESMQERHIFWNFISTRKERIEQAKADWKAGNFPLIPDDHEEFIPLPE